VMRPHGDVAITPIDATLGARTISMRVGND
jgi:hypothetical protein